MVLGLIFFISCSENKPDSLAPSFVVNEAQAVTRHSAYLSGSISVSGNKTVIKNIYFRYGQTEDMTERMNCNASSQMVGDTIKNLLAGMKYYYCLVADNNSSSAQSDIHSFTTNPNDKPTVGAIRISSHSPLSAILRFAVSDNGGEELTDVGVYYQETGGTELKQSATITSDSVYNLRISGLKANTSYTLQPFATNRFGERRGVSYTFQTGDEVVLDKAGSLKQTIGDDKYSYTKLVVAGPMNGSDLCFLREMMGIDFKDGETNGRLSDIDLTDASIVKGGDAYCNSRYSANDTIGYGLFKDCKYLKKVILPDGIKVIEQEAFQNCVALEELQIPSATQSLLSSSGCTALKSITVVSTNTNYESKDGVLYNKGITKIIWFPQGKDDETFTLPSTITSLERLAFRDCKLKEITLSNVQLIPYGVFENCTNLSSVTLGSATNYLSEYCFNKCPLTALHVKNTTITPHCSSTSLSGVTDIFNVCTLYVPTGYKSLYRSSSVWTQFKKIVEE